MLQVYLMWGAHVYHAITAKCKVGLFFQWMNLRKWDGHFIWTKPELTCWLLAAEETTNQLSPVEFPAERDEPLIPAVGEHKAGENQTLLPNPSCDWKLKLCFLWHFSIYHRSLNCDDYWIPIIKSGWSGIDRLWTLIGSIITRRLGHYAVASRGTIMTGNKEIYEFYAAPTRWTAPCTAV